MMEDKPQTYYNLTPLIVVGGFVLLLLIIPLIFWYYMYVQIVLTGLLFAAFGYGGIRYLKFVGDTVMGLVDIYFKTCLTYQRLKREKTINESLTAFPDLIQIAMREGHNVEYKGLKISDWRSNVHTLGTGNSVSEEEQSLLSAPTVDALPRYVAYDDIRKEIPEGHNLVGIGPQGLITKQSKLIGALVWIIGLSGTGKTSTMSLRLEERAASGHQFLGLDPHWYKDDSLTNAIVGFADRFILPIARSTTENLRVLNFFLEEFNARKAGLRPKPFQPITLVVDELGSFNDPHDEDEEKVLKLLKSITRISGQEARNFEMGEIVASQQATGLYWVGDVALMIIVHKLIKESQQRLATNIDDKKLFAEMRVWPKGRTYVYGAGLEEGEGCMIIQQPHFEKPAIGSWEFTDTPPVTPEERGDLDLVRSAVNQLQVSGQKPTVRGVASLVPFEKTKVAELLKLL